MTTDKPLLFSGLGIGLDFGFTSRSCSSGIRERGAGTQSSFVQELAYRAHSVRVSRQCSWPFTTTQLYNRDAKDRVPVPPPTQAQARIHRFSDILTLLVKAEARTTNTSTFSCNLVNISSRCYQYCRKFLLCRRLLVFGGFQCVE